MNPLRRDLEYFQVIFDCANLSKASTILGLRQSTLSRSLMKLENDFGEALFIRRKSGLLATPFAQRLKRELATLTHNWDKAIEESGAELREPAGYLKMGMHPIIALSFGISFMGRMADKYPKIELDLCFDSSRTLTEAVINFEIDFALVAMTRRHPDLVIRKVAREDVAAFSHGSSPDTSMAFYNPDTIDIQKIQRKLKLKRWVPIRDYEVLASLAKQEKKIAVLPRSVARRHGLVNEHGSPFYWANIDMIYRSDRPRTKAVDLTLETLRASIARG